MKFRYSSMLAALVLSAVMVAGCGKEAAQQSTNVAVNAYKVNASDTAIKQSFSGTIKAENSVAVHARVSGYVVEKYVQGGEQVIAGQPLYRIDSRQYEANLANAEATAASSRANLQNAQVDLKRYQILSEQDAIARQTYDTQASTVQQSAATLEAYEAAVKIAQDNLSDTIIYAPYSGTLEMDDIDLGTYVTAGSTALVTIDSIDPVIVEFSMTEPEYLQFMTERATDSTGNGGVQLQLADGSTYAYEGSIVQAAKSLDSGTGKLILKASFANPDHLLLPNMFATVTTSGATVKNAILVPSKAILQVMDKNFIYVIGANGKVTQTAVELAGTTGGYTIIKSGLKAGDEIVVDGLTKVKNGVTVKATLLTKEQVESSK